MSGQNPEQTNWDDLWTPNDRPQSGATSAPATVVTPAYVDAAVQRELDGVRVAPEGQRNDTLNRAAFSLGQLVGGGVLVEDQAAAALVAAAAQSGLGDHEARATAASGLRAGQAEPRRLIVQAGVGPVPEVTSLHEVSPGAPRGDWRPRDLSAVLDGTWAPATPSVGRRSDGIGLFYPGKVHTVASESEAGKTWFALSAVVDELAAGEHVLYVDGEDDEGGVVGRLLALQVDREAVRDRFHYVRPETALGAGVNLDDLRSALVQHEPTLAVLDGVTELMTLHGLDPLNNKDVAAFGRILPRRIADAGPAVVCLDHVVKDRDGRGRYALGGVHKLNGLDGAAFLLDNRRPFGIGRSGVTTVRIAKDRPSQLRKAGLPSAGGLFWFADLTLESHDEEFAEVEVKAPEQRLDDDFRPTELMGRICAVIEDKGPLSGAKINALVTGKAATIRQAIALLQVDGYLSDQTPHELRKKWLGGGSDA